MSLFFDLGNLAKSSFCGGRELHECAEKRKSSDFRHSIKWFPGVRVRMSFSTARTYIFVRFWILNPETCIFAAACVVSRFAFCIHGPGAAGDVIRTSAVTGVAVAYF